MKVVIVARTQTAEGFCISGVTFDGRPIRFQVDAGSAGSPAAREWIVGDVWDLEVKPDGRLDQVAVQNRRRLPPVEDVVRFIHYQMPPTAGSPAALFDGLAGGSDGERLRLSDPDRGGRSLAFWQPDRPLQRENGRGGVFFRYPVPGGGPTLAYAGLAEPPAEIPAGSLVCVTLGEGPAGMPESGCDLLLAGWFQPAVEGPTSRSFELPPPDFPEPIPAASLPPRRPPGTLAEGRVLLKKVFGFDDFRFLQEAVVDNILKKRDTLAIMPTGSGKSLCYQLAALLFSGLTVVVSPLIALMQDQVDQLRELGVPAAFLNSTLSHPEVLAIYDLVRTGRIKLLYAAPETLLRPDTLALLQQVVVDCLTIDEAHCISDWGHDFRPEYRQLIELRRRLEGAVCLAVTATATEQVRRDITTSLAIASADEFVASFNRENLHLEVAPKVDELGQTLNFLAAHPDDSGIIYCATRRQVDDLAAALKSRGWPVLPYHAGLDDQTRREHQRLFLQDDFPIMVATIAFGMGINKSNVRFILHTSLPKNLESYYQQIGRAGRDGLRSDCLLLFSYSDVQTINYFIQQQEETRQIGARLRLEAMLGFAETNLCRRRPLLTYFGEPAPEEPCDLCDNCLRDEADLVDLTIPAKKFLSCVKRTGERFGMTHIIEVLCGSRSQRVLARGHDRLSTYNIGGEFSRKEWKVLARQFIQQGLLSQDLEHGGLSLTERAYAVFQGERVEGILPDREVPKPTRPVDLDYDRPLFERLRAKRKALADAGGIPPYVIFSDRTLVELAYYFPRTLEAFGSLYGVGEVKKEKYGPIFLPLIQAYCQERGLAERPRGRDSASATTAAVRSVAGGRRRAILERFRAGETVAAMADSYGVKIRTILDHLWQALRAGEALPPADLEDQIGLPPETQARAVEAFAAHGLDYLRPVYDALGGTVDYDTLNLLRLDLALKKRGAGPAGE